MADSDCHHGQESRQPCSLGTSGETWGRACCSSLNADGEEGKDFLACVSGNEPTPEFSALFADECWRLLDLLNDNELRGVAVLKMEGYTNAEIATKIGKVEGTVERKLAIIRDRWGKETRP